MPKMPKRTGQGGPYSNMPRKHRGDAAETGGHGMKARTPHPNGGEVRRVDIGKAEPKMPRTQRVASITHTDVMVDGGKMPRTMRGGYERDPFRR